MGNSISLKVIVSLIFVSGSTSKKYLAGTRLTKINPISPWRKQVKISLHLIALTQ